MSSYITFRPSDIKLPGALKLSVTKNVFDKLASFSLNSEAVLKSLSSSSTLLLTNTLNDNEFEIHTLNGIFVCSPNPDGDSLLLVGYGANTLNKQNKVLKYGIGFITSEIIVQIRLYNSYNISYDLVNGNAVDKDVYKNVSSHAAFQTICSVMSDARRTNKPQDEEADEEPDYEPAKKLSSLLDIAENYSVLSSELEKNIVNSLGKISYHDLSSVQFNRVDRVAYSFIVDSLEEAHFKVGVQIDIEDKSGNRHTAEIINLIKNNDNYEITVLFSDHIDFSSLNTTGWFTLSYSTVNRDVQLDANEKIRTGSSAAKYMDAVLGYNQPTGFTKKDLTKLRNDLNSKKYPPNASQVNAIVSGIETNDVFLVMGPPGTGKTTVILEWVKYFVIKERKRVLVSSQNNKAVDNVLARIAEEKDINVIRIGSESKVQSDVVPFLFENKISTKRNDIIDETQRNLDTLNDIHAKWRTFYDELKLLFTDASKVAEEKSAFKTVLKQTVLPLYKQLDALRNDSIDIQQQKRIKHKEILDLYCVIETSRTTKNIFKRILGKLSYSSKSIAMTNLIKEYDSICDKEKAIVNEYNQNMRSLGSLLNQIYSSQFSSYFAIYTEWSKKCAMISQKMPPNSNMWKLFSGIIISTRILSQYTSFKQLLISIDAEISRLIKIRSAIENWQQTVRDQQNYALNEIILDSVNLVGATCIGINSQKRFADLRFDVTIIDEAGQIQIHNALVPMSVSNKLIMLGDHKQIPPTADQELLDACIQNGISTELLEKSLFEKMYELLPESNKIMLDTQYRMPAEIANTISDWFYDKKYYSPDFKKNLPSLIPKLSGRPYVIIDTSVEPNRFETKIPDAGCNNHLEAEIVFKIIKSLIAENKEIDLKEIGVISAYKSQVKLISAMLIKLVDEDIVNEMVATLDSYQGQERDIIIYSFTKSSAEPPQKKRIGFLNELRRLNVAMTRCKKMLILIGDMHFLSTCENTDFDSMQRPIYDKSEKQFSDFIKKMLIDVINGSGEAMNFAEFNRRIDACNPTE